uniref:Cadherin domain-containing protein n=1 Tax=Astyanax mexicanus TaxID=7994 RepID=A0A8B9HNV3_ASTMX
IVTSLNVIYNTNIILADPDGGGGEQTLRRQKREWIIPPRKLMENVDYTNLKYIAKIRSDEETRTTILYSLKGKGADEEPVGLFQVDRLQGLVTIHGILDRETTSSYHLLGVAKFQNGSYAEKDIDLRIEVQDQNDCSPVFNIQAVGSVYELSETGTYIINITATDADKPNTPHSQIAYSIVEQSPAGNLFYIDRGSGKIFVSRSSLDREVQESYTLKIIGSDMNGQPGGNTGTGTVSINVLDVNDNVPTLEKNSVSCTLFPQYRNAKSQCSIPVIDPYLPFAVLQQDIPLLQVPTELDAGIKTGHVEGLGEKGHWGAGGWGGGREDGMMNTREDWHFNEHFNDFNGNYNSMFVTGGHAGRGGMGAFEGIALSEAFLGDYYSKKSNFMAEHQAAGESLLVFDFEGEGGNAGPLDDICAELHDGDDLAFLNDLGPQFRALAELCRGSAIDIEVSSVKKPPAPEPAPARVHLNVREEGSKGVSASASSSSTHMTSMDYRQSGTASTAVSTAGVLTHTVPSQTLLIQQPAVYYTSTPVYVVDPKPQATLLVASGPVLGMQENVVLVDQRGGSLVQGASTLGKLNQTQTKVLLEKKPVRGAAIVEGSGPQVLLGHSEVGSGSVRIVESGRVQTMEPVRTVQSSLHSSIREGQSIQLGQGLTGSHKSLAVAQHEQPLLTVPHAHGGTHQKVREERISVIEKSFQSSAAV